MKAIGYDIICSMMVNTELQRDSHHKASSVVK